MLAALPTLCAAQGNVTLYGIVDTGVAYLSNQGGAQAWKTQSSNLSGSRWGLRGAEDLGDGVQAIFLLENGFDINSEAMAQGNREFGRQAYVGRLSSAAQWASIVGAHVQDMDDLAPAFRVNNAIKYTSVNYNGFSFGGLYGASNQAGEFATNRAWSLGARYSHGPLVLALGYFMLNHPAAPGTAGAVGASGAGTGSDYRGAFALKALDGNGTITRHQTFAAGGSYTAGRATLGLVYSHVVFDATGASARADNYEINGRYQASPALLLGAAYVFTDGRSDTGQRPKYHQINLGADYFLSKRTDLYLVGLYQRAAGDAQNAGLNLLPASSTNVQTEVMAGIRHVF
ncbi:MAG: porin [Burkholderiales bacterium]|nr:porin [Burkholderiales bacterium]